MPLLDILRREKDTKSSDPGPVKGIFDDMRKTIKDVRNDMVSSTIGDLAGNVVKYTIRDRMKRRGFFK